MTAPSPATRRRAAPILRRGRSIALFVLGALWEVYCVLNVPGTATFVTSGAPEARITDLGTGLALLAIAAWGTVFVRARAPWAVLAAGAVLALIGTSYVLALVGATRVLARSPRHSKAVALGVGALVLLFAARESLTDWGAALPWTVGYDPHQAHPGWQVVPWAIAVLALGAAAGLIAYRRTRVEADASRARAEREHQRADALGEQVARQAERERIARDLHDGIGHRLSSAALSASAFEAKVTADPSLDPALAEWARLVREQAHAALDDVRGVVGGLRMDTEPASPRASLRFVGDLLSDLRAAGHRVDALVVMDGADRAGASLQAAAYRILQESLTNAIRHAPGVPVSVTLHASPERGVRLRVVNPVAPVPPVVGATGGGHGLAGIRERAASAGGTAWIGPHEGEFIVDVTLPWSEGPSIP
ncbi:histidine kinase [Microbacterium sp. NPDC096154]|uniref:sensor histidine kinase n=1 Tax=Microbacterium sp. NPDC096154 TaxID=3155549 RepID=UPI003331B110